MNLENELSCCVHPARRGEQFTNPFSRRNPINGRFLCAKNYASVILEEYQVNARLPTSLVKIPNLILRSKI